MSNFISSISAAGLSEMPPVSNVMPLPTSTTGASRLRRAVVLAATMKLRRLVASPARRRGRSPCRASRCRLRSSTSTFELELACRASCACSREIGRRADVGAAGCRACARASMPSAVACASRERRADGRASARQRERDLRSSGWAPDSFSASARRSDRTRRAAPSTAWRTFQPSAPLGDLEVDEEERGVLRAQLAQHVAGGAHGVAEGAPPQIPGARRARRAARARRPHWAVRAGGASLPSLPGRSASAWRSAPLDFWSTRRAGAVSPGSWHFLRRRRARRSPSSPSRARACVC